MRTNQIPGTIQCNETYIHERMHAISPHSHIAWIHLEKRSLSFCCTLLLACYYFSEVWNCIPCHWCPQTQYLSPLSIWFHIQWKLQRLGERDGITWERNTTSFSFRTSPISYPFTTTSNECKDRMKWIIFPGIATRPFYTLRMQQRTMVTVSVLRDNNSWSQQERTGREVREMNTAAIWLALAPMKRPLTLRCESSVVVESIWLTIVWYRVRGCQVYHEWRRKPAKGGTRGNLIRITTLCDFVHHEAVRSLW